MRVVGSLVLLVLVVAAFVVWLRGRALPGADRDLAVIAQLEAAGSDLSKPHEIEFFLYFPSEQAANHAASRLRNASFGVEVQLGADGTRWLCLATRSLVPTHDALASSRALLEALASELGGEYDGWGAPVVP